MEKYLEKWAANQFKQLYLFTNLNCMVEQYTIKVSWSFFATNHRKGAKDGIGEKGKTCVE